MASLICKVTPADRSAISLASGDDIDELLIDACDNLEILYNTSCKVSTLILFYN